jgi:hypothetical protein
LLCTISSGPSTKATIGFHNQPNIFKNHFLFLYFHFATSDAAFFAFLLNLKLGFTTT